MKEKTDYEKIRVVIFDCDGVMFDSRKANAAYYNTILKHFGKDLLCDRDLEIVHMSTAGEAVDYLFRDDPRLAAAQDYRSRVDYTTFIPLMTMEPYLAEVLGVLREEGYGLAVATNRTTTIHPLLKIFKLHHYFDLVVSSLDVIQPKPHPETVFKILKHFQIKPHEALYVGDSVVDYEVTRKADIPFIAYKGPHLCSDCHIDDLRELLRLLACGRERQRDVAGDGARGKHGV
ncbi:MAG: HAD-IA family hydrolase [Deltaproteobacteria bacterium]|nr:HAD-IA family hydrolase [Deltaproteobacteria bacterium]